MGYVNEIDKSRIFYRGSTVDEAVLRPNTGSEHGVAGISTSPDEDYAKMHGDYVRRYYAIKGDFIDFFNLIALYDDKHGEEASFNATDVQLTEFAKSMGYIGSIFHDPQAGTDYRFFDAESLAPVDFIQCIDI